MSAPANPLSEHALSHILSELEEQRLNDNPDVGPLTESEVRSALTEAGYGPACFDQVWIAYIGGWPECATCGDPATHMWGTVAEDGKISSIAGPWKLAPSCDGCGGFKFDDGAGQPVVRARLGKQIATAPVAQYSMEGLADAAGHDPDFLARILRSMDPGDARTVMAITLRAYCQHVASVTEGELSFQEALLNTIVEVEVGD